MKRQTSGSVVCPSCGRLVGVQDDSCSNCGRLRPGMFGFTNVLRNLGDDLGFARLTIGSCAVLYVLMLITDPSAIGGGGLFNFLAPGFRSSFLFGATGTIPVLQFDRWWTVLSAIWLHGGIVHIMEN